MKHDFHNPDGLTPEQVGEDYRLLLKSELGHQERIPGEAWIRRYTQWAKVSGLAHHSVTYRVPLSTWPLPEDPYRELKEAKAELAAIYSSSEAEALAEANANSVRLLSMLEASHAREAQLREALSEASSAISTRIQGRLVHAYVREQFPATAGHIPLNDYWDVLGATIVNIAGTLSLSPPPVIPVEDVKP